MAANRHRRHTTAVPHAHQPAYDPLPAHGGLLVLLAGVTGALQMIELGIALTT